MVGGGVSALLRIHDWITHSNPWPLSRAVWQPLIPCSWPGMPNCEAGIRPWTQIILNFSCLWLQYNAVSSQNSSARSVAHWKGKLVKSWWPQWASVKASTNSKASGIQSSKPSSSSVCILLVWYFRISCLLPRQCLLCVKDSHCTYLFMWGQFYRISNCGLEHQLLGSTEVYSTHLDCLITFAWL